MGLPPPQRLRTPTWEHSHRVLSTHPALPSPVPPQCLVPPAAVPPAAAPPGAHYGPRLLAVVRAPAAAHLVAVVDPLRLLLLQALAVVDAAGAEAVVGVVDLLLLCKGTDPRGSVPPGCPGDGDAPHAAPAPTEQLTPPVQRAALSSSHRCHPPPQVPSCPWHRAGLSSLCSPGKGSGSFDNSSATTDGLGSVIVGFKRTLRERRAVAPAHEGLTPISHRPPGNGCSCTGLKGDTGTQSQRAPGRSQCPPKAVSEEP